MKRIMREDMILIEYTDALIGFCSDLNLYAVAGRQVPEMRRGVVRYMVREALEKV